MTDDRHGTTVDPRWVEKGAQALLADAGWKSAHDAARAVLAAVLPDVRPVVDRETLVRAMPCHPDCGSHLRDPLDVRYHKHSCDTWRRRGADALIASGIWQDAADVRRQMAEALADATEWTVLGHPGWPGCAPTWRHREHAEEFLARYPHPEAQLAWRYRSEFTRIARETGETNTQGQTQNPGGTP